MYKHILLPYDGSELSDRALAEGISFAKSAGSKVTLMHVVTPYRVPISGDHSSSTLKTIEHQHAVEVEKLASEMLEKARRRVDSAGVQCDMVMRPGYHPHEEIIETAKNLNCDLVLMASHGRRGLQGLLLGSETVKVLTHCTIPVLVVR
jgi:nucleotide-binding universal stress UspA family protein